MAPRPRHKLELADTEQTSPFLRLPGEIRTLIYRFALVKSDGIDLCPASVIYTDDIDHNDVTPELAQRTIGRGSRALRNQEDLAFVRRELSVALLGTCRQIQAEAMGIFWQDNQFRFSTDFEWILIRRFLTTLRPQARSLIECIEVAPPSSGSTLRRIDNDGGRQHWLYGSQVGNHPKLRMTKPFLKIEGFKNCPRTRRKRCWQSNDNFVFVSNLLREDRTLKELRYVVREGWTMGCDLKGWQKEFNITDLGLLDFVDLTLVVEKGAQLAGMDSIATITGQGIKLVAMPGSAISPLARSAFNYSPHAVPILEDIKVRTEWDPYSNELEGYLWSLTQLFDESTASENKIGRYAGRRVDIARKLGSFGGCRFVQREGYYCYNCGQQTKQSTILACKICKTKTRYEYKDNIEIRKMAREKKKSLGNL